MGNILAIHKGLTPQQQTNFLLLCCDHNDFSAKDLDGCLQGLFSPAHGFCGQDIVAIQDARYEYPCVFSACIQCIDPNTTHVRKTIILKKLQVLVDHGIDPSGIQKHASDFFAKAMNMASTFPTLIEWMAKNNVRPQSGVWLTTRWMELDSYKARTTVLRNYLNHMGLDPLKKCVPGHISTGFIALLNVVEPPEQVFVAQKFADNPSWLTEEDLQRGISFCKNDNVNAIMKPMVVAFHKRMTRLALEERNNILDSLHCVRKEQDKEEQEICPICHSEDDDDGDGSWRTLSCEHDFHDSCLMRWLSGSGAPQKCPICQTPM